MSSKYAPDAPVKMVMTVNCTLGHPRSCKAGQVLMCVPNAHQRNTRGKQCYAGYPSAPFYQPYDWINEQYGSESCLLVYLASVSALMPYVDVRRMPVGLQKKFRDASTCAKMKINDCLVFVQVLNQFVVWCRSHQADGDAHAV